MTKKFLLTIFIFLSFITKSISSEFIGVIGVAVGDINNQKNEKLINGSKVFFGGTIFTLLASYIIANYFTIFSIYNPITISLFIPFTATTGDFIESYYKREAKVKDSGNLLPGHGGILDRMDAFMITIPILYIYINYII